MKKKIILSSIGVLVLVGAGFLVLSGSKNSDDKSLPRIKVIRGDITDKALAVGTIEPENEISIKSKVSGVVSRIYADAGIHVRAGQLLLEVRPEPTPLELADAKRGVEMAQVDVDNMSKERTREEQLIKKALISAKEYEDFQKSFDESALRLNIAKEKLALTESGRVKIGSTNIE